jgi:hypothetical protein
MKLALPSCYSCQSNFGIRQTLLAVTGLFFVLAEARHLSIFQKKKIRLPYSDEGHSPILHVFPAVWEN